MRWAKKNGCLIAYGLPQEPYAIKQPSYLFDRLCPPTLPVFELPKLLKHCLSRKTLAMTIPAYFAAQRFFIGVAKLLPRKGKFFQLFYLLTLKRRFALTGLNQNAAISKTH